MRLEAKMAKMAKMANMAKMAKMVRMAKMFRMVRMVVSLLARMSGRRIPALESPSMKEAVKRAKLVSVNLQMSKVGLETPLVGF